MRTLVIAAVALIGWSGHAWAWGDTGHQIVCEIAFRLVGTDTKAAIRKLIANDTEYDTFTESCIFPDHPHKRASEHFINLPRTDRQLTSDDCPAANKCLLTAIKKDFEVLSSSGSQKERLASLKYLGHWVGDIHQPLHVSFEDDKGGNGITVSGECSGKMHSAWDTCLVKKAVGDDVAEAADDLLTGVTRAMIEDMAASEPRDWANESFAIAEDAQTKYCVQHGTSCDSPPSKHVTIDAAYVAMSKPVIRNRLLKAGARLSHLLDEALGN